MPCSCIGSGEGACHSEMFNKGQTGHLAQAWKTSSRRPSVADGLTYSSVELLYSPLYKM